MPWYSLNCGDPTLADHQVDAVLKQRRRLVERRQLPESAAIYSRHESRGSLHCELFLYFTPDAAPIAEAVGALICAKPEPQGLSPLLH